MFYFAQEAIIPMRAEAAESAEMVSQLVFGEFCEVLEDQGSWWRVRLLVDGYEGWVNPRMLWPVGSTFEPGWKQRRFVLGGNLILADGSSLRLPIGTEIPHTGSEDSLSLGEKNWRYAPDLQLLEPQAPEELITLAGHYLNIPYVWGGRSGFGIDCSGFTQRLFAMCGMAIPRDSSKQALEGEKVEIGSQKAGDLAFFSKNPGGSVSHVGLLASESEIIHASGRVKRDPFCPEGIRSRDHDTLTHYLISIRRWF
ncbi:MAG: C40 family peptidase [Bacteroidota bacterium]